MPTKRKQVVIELPKEVTDSFSGVLLNAPISSAALKGFAAGREINLDRDSGNSVKLVVEARLIITPVD